MKQPRLQKYRKGGDFEKVAMHVPVHKLGTQVETGELQQSGNAGASVGAGGGAFWLLLFAVKIAPPLPSTSAGAVANGALWCSFCSSCRWSCWRSGTKHGCRGSLPPDSKFLSIVCRARMISTRDNGIYTGSVLRRVIPYV
jgi:hypothetical protein